MTSNMGAMGQIQGSPLVSTLFRSICEDDDSDDDDDEKVDDDEGGGSGELGGGEAEPMVEVTIISRKGTADSVCLPFGQYFYMAVSRDEQVEHEDQSDSSETEGEARSIILDDQPPRPSAMSTKGHHHRPAPAPSGPQIALCSAFSTDQQGHRGGSTTPQLPLRSALRSHSSSFLETVSDCATAASLSSSRITRSVSFDANVETIHYRRSLIEAEHDELEVQWGYRWSLVQMRELAEKRRDRVNKKAGRKGDMWRCPEVGLAMMRTWQDIDVDGGKV